MMIMLMMLPYADAFASAMMLLSLIQPFSRRDDAMLMPLLPALLIRCFHMPLMMRLRAFRCRARDYAFQFSRDV